MLKTIKTLMSKAEGDVASPAALKKARMLIYGLVGGLFFIFLFFLFAGSDQTSAKPSQKQKNAKKLASADEVVDSREIWVNRVEREAREARREAEDVRRENQILRKRVDVMDEMYTKFGAPQVSQERAPSTESVKPIAQKVDVVKAQPLPVQSFSQNEGEQSLTSQALPSMSSVSSPQIIGPKILHLSLPAQEYQQRKTVDAYIPAGTYARAVLTSGVVASTSSTAQGDPQPIFVRLVDHGNIPRGFKGDLKDAVLIGACYGDLSAERAYCRIHKMSLTERNGEILEKKIEGWLVGEDGRPGLKGIVVDRAGEVARGALVSGILSGMASFFKQQTTSSVYPVSPFGQTNALDTRQVLQGSAANGAGNALDKLADFTIKRAEALQPVILVNPGREVDVVFKEGIDLSETGVKQQMLLIGQSQREERARQEAQEYAFDIY